METQKENCGVWIQLGESNVLEKKQNKVSQESGHEKLCHIKLRS